MTIAPRDPRCERPRRVLLAAVALGLALLAPAGPAPASSILPATGIPADDSHHCKCGVRCRGHSCCCGPRKASPRPSAPRPDRAGVDAGPCLDSAPCDAPGLPNGPTSIPDGKGAVLAGLAGLPHAAAGAYFSPSSHRPLPARRASRLDEPPERLGLA